MNSNQLLLLLWKIYLVQKRTPVLTILELLLPAILSIILLPIRQMINTDDLVNNTVYDAFNLEDFDNNFVIYKNSTFGYYPNTSQRTNEITKVVSEKFRLNFESFKTEAQMVEYLCSDLTYHLFGIGVLDDRLENFTYQLRFPHSPRYQDPVNEWKEWKTHQIFPKFETLGPRDKSSKYGGAPGYYTEGFLVVQKAIDFAVINLFDKQINDVEVFLKRFPYGPYVHDNFVVILIAVFPYIIQLSFIFTVIFTAKSIVQEKETGLKEGMKLMGMKSSIYWLSWYLKAMLSLIPSMIVMVICFKLKLTLNNGAQASIIDRSDSIVISILLFLYASSLTTFILMCTSFFKKSNSASTGTAIIYILSFMPHIYLSLNYETLNSFIKICSCFVNNLAMCLGVHIVSILEGIGLGANFSNISQGVYADEHFSLLHVMVIMVINNFIHLLILYYVDNVYPGDFGIPKPWNFFYTRKNFKSIYKKNDYDNAETPRCLFEDESIYSSKNIGIQLKNVSKYFKQINGKIVKSVNNLSLNVYEGQITALLGHNGAGKSTTLSMITGNLKPDFGNVFIYNNDIVENCQNARSVLGYCPQHNLLFDNLTVYEHLVLFSKLKQQFNMSEIDRMLEMINLTEKRNSLAKTLSGGMKRKLSVAIAFIGGSKVVILDEPSSGMDPQSRHLTWSILKKFRNENRCTILLTTHFMDEADFLGDRIAIMSQGGLKCCGSPLFLTSQYASGYDLILTLERSSPENISEICKIVQANVRESRLKSSINLELSFRLSAKYTQDFPTLLDKLDEIKENFFISNLSISANTIEHVFLKIEETNYALTDKMEEKFSKKFETDEDQCLWVGSKPEDLVFQKSLFMLKQFKALIQKRFIHTIRNKSLSLAQILIPVSFVFINLLYIKLAILEPEHSPALKIKLSDYGQNYAPYSIKDNQTDGILSKLSIIYKSLLITDQNTQTFELTEINKINMCQSHRDSVENYLNCLGRNSFRMLNKQHFIATEFSYYREKIQITGSFNNQPYHVAPLSLNLITNSLFKYFTNSSQYSITVINNPLPKNPSEILNESSIKSFNNFRIGTALNFGLSFLVASFSMFLIKEKTCGSKHLQFLSGCSPFTFWLSSFTWDFLNYIIPVFIIVLLFTIFNVTQIVGEDRIFYLLALLILYGLAHIPQTYLFSFLFKVSSSGFSFITAWNIFTSQIGLIIIRILTIPNLGTSQIAGHLEIIFMTLFPNFAMGQAIIDLYDNYENLKLCQDASYGCRYEPNPCCRYVKQLKRKKACGDFDCLYWNNDYWSWEKPGLSRYAISLLFQFLIHIAFLYLIESSFFCRKKYLPSRLNSKEIQNSEVDSDVRSEKIRVENSISYKDHDNFMVSSLSKFYLNFKAVNQISFGVKFKECFGLLGVNGAGKTSTFKMITGQEEISNGEVFIDKISLASHRNKYQNRLGYCPQIDPLIDQMTVFETIMLFMSLRGIRNELAINTTLSLINIFDLNEHANKMCYTLSGGNKRKLSVALALIGSPNVILLDEPTSGMDPKTRRVLWNCINKIRIRGKSLILTTHSMEEAEALCTKIAIMVNGEFKCFGSLQHLKNKFGDGFTLMVRIRTRNKNLKEFIDFVTESFNQCELRENRDNYLKFHLTNDSKNSLSKIFSLMESIKLKYLIDHYCLTQINLEQIFFNFVSKQKDYEK